MALYVWEATIQKGIPEMLEFYKPSGTLPYDVLKRWTLKGVDCSGLLYEATRRLYASQYRFPLFFRDAC